MRRSVPWPTPCDAHLEPSTRVTAFGVEGWPACGTPPEALRAHGLDGASLAVRIEQVLSLAARQ